MIDYSEIIQQTDYQNSSRVPNKAGAKIFLALMLIGLLLFFLGIYYLDGTHPEVTNALNQYFTFL